MSSVKKTFIILEQFTPLKPEWGVTELAKKLNSNKSTVYRFLSNMHDLGVVKQDAISGKYSLGLKLFELGNRVAIQSSFVNKTHPELIKVALDITETVHIGIFKSNKVFYVDKVESPQGLKMSSHIGSYGPVHATSLGKVLLANMPPEQEELKKRIVSGNTLKFYTKNTITTEKGLLKELKKVKKEGYALDKEEFEIGLICIAIPIFNQKKEIVASLSASGPANRFEEEAIEKYVTILKTGADAIQQKIGFFRF